MRNFKKLVGFMFVLVAVIAFNNTKCIAAETVVTWDPINKPVKVNLYDNNLTIDGAGGYDQIITTTGGGYSTGKYYWEVTTSPNNYGVGSDDGLIGVKDVLSTILYDFDARIGYWSQTDKVPGSNYIEGNSTIGVLLDLDNHVLMY